uniref:SH3 domain-containing protein n=1 Tax=Strongyloides venezuelensis TaxID=75913 RepID=A0A0K0EVF9_STRVS
MSIGRRASLQCNLFRECNVVDNNESYGDYKSFCYLKKFVNDQNNIEQRHNSFSNLRHNQLALGCRSIIPRQSNMNGVTGYTPASSSNSSPNHHRSSQPSICYYSRSDLFDGSVSNRETSYPHSIVERSKIIDQFGSPRLGSNGQRKIPQHVLYHTPSQPILKLSHNTQQICNPYTPTTTPYDSPIAGRKLPMKPIGQQRLLHRAPKSDLNFRFQRHLEEIERRSLEKNPEEIDPVYLALKQAHKTYGRRSSSSHNCDSISPSPRNLSQTSLQDSGYIEAVLENRSRLLGSTPLLNQQNISPHNCQNSNYGQAIPNIQQQTSDVYSPILNTTSYQVQQFTTPRKRPPKLEKQMKSLSLDCADMPPVMTSTVRSPYRNNNNTSNPNTSIPMQQQKQQQQVSRNVRVIGKHNEVGNELDKGSSVNSLTASPRKLPPQNLPLSQLMHVVIHEYRSPKATFSLMIGQRMRIVDNGDPDWLHGFIIGDLTESLLTFPSTCVSPIYGNEQPMRVTQNIMIPDTKLRLYRDQVVFAQADTIRTDNKVLVRTERDKFAHCPLSNLQIL